MNAMRTEWEQRYQEAEESKTTLPWDSQITPPEVVDFWQSKHADLIQPGERALDLGCGTGTNGAYLVGLGFEAIGIELAGGALAVATKRHQELRTKQGPRLNLIHGSVADVPLQQQSVAYVLDIGCYHTLPQPERRRYIQSVIEVLRPGGFYQLYGFDREADASSSDRGIGPTEMADNLRSAMEMVYINQATPNPKPCRWYLFRKRVSDLQKIKV